MDVNRAFETARQHLEAGHADQAEALCRRILEARPGQWDTRHLLGLALYRGGDLAAAAEVLLPVVRERPQARRAAVNLAKVLAEAGRHADALAPLEATLAACPEAAEVGLELGAALYTLGRWEAALDRFDRALAASSGFSAACNFRGLTLEKLDRLDEAEAAYRQAIDTAPALVEARFNLGNLLAARGRRAAARTRFDEVLARDPEHAEAHAHRAMLSLLEGDYAAGWAEYEWRLRTRAFAPLRRRFPTCRRWRGDDVAGRTVLLVAEQGAGDLIQFIRFAGAVAGRGARVVFECPLPLRPVMATVDGIDTLVTEGEPLPPWDRCAGLLSLPGLLGTTVDTVPAAVPYMTAPADRVAIWDARLGPPAGRRRVGLAWQGNRAYGNDRKRSVPAATMARLPAAVDVQFVAVQKEIADADRRALAGVAFVGPAFEDFGDTAAVLSRLDLVVTVDTAVAHLAGALGVPTWLMVPFVPDWRWLLDRDDSPWYPTVRLFRQPAPGDWESVVSRVGADLAAWAAR